MQKMVYGIILQMLQLHSEWGRVEHGGNFMSMAGSEACKDFRNPERSASTSKLKAGPYLDSSSNKTILSGFFSLQIPDPMSIDPKSCQCKKIRRHQEKVWTFREERHKIGRGPAASIGDADDFALGLGADEFEDATPRRRCILDSLSLEAGPCCQLWHW